MTTKAFSMLAIEDIRKYRGVKFPSISFVIISFFLLDIINFFISRKSGVLTYDSIALYGKGAVEILMFVCILWKGKDKFLSFLLLVFICIPFIWIVKFVDLFEVQLFSWSIFKILKDINKFIFPVVIFLYIRDCVDEPKLISLKVFEILFALMAIVVIVAYMFDISLLYTYGDKRFGFTPPLTGRNEVSFFWVIGIIYFFKKWQLEPSARTLVFLIVLIIASFLLGAKSVFLSFFIIVGYVSFFAPIKRVYKMLLVCFGFLLCITPIVFISRNLQSESSIQQFPDMLSVLTSLRSVIFVNDFVPIIKSWEWWNYLFGGRFMDKFPIVEMDVFDLFLMVGFTGVILYFYILFKTIFSFQFKNNVGWLFVIQFLVVGSLSGHVFNSGINAILIAFVCMFLQLNQGKHIPDLMHLRK
jgi:hypothetical protein